VHLLGETRPPQLESVVNAANIREQREVIGSCGKLLGHVDGLEGSSIKLTRDSSDDDQHHYIPMDWVARVDEHVHLSKDCGEAKQEWGAAPIGAGA
jgi:hypothetical protein